MMNVYNLKIDNIRGDDDSAFRNDLRNWLKENRITYYFSPFKYTNRNKVIDRVMRTIRDMFDIMGSSVQLYCPQIIEMIVNNTIIKYTNLYLISLLLTKHNTILLSNRPL
jgi:hypothetical protein